MSGAPIETTDAAPAEPFVQRYWRWIFPLGCLTFAAAALAFVWFVLYLVFGAMKSNEAYQLGLQRAKDSPAVQAALGTPVKEGYVLVGKVIYEGETPHAEINVPLEGPEGEGTLFIMANEIGGVWVFERLEVAVEGRGERIDLLGTD